MKSTWIFVLISAALGLAAVATYVDAVDNEFVWDDPIVFKRQLPYFEGFHNIFFPPPGIPQWGSYYRPMIVVTYLADEGLAKSFWPEEEREAARQFTYHASCIAYHAIATILVFLFGVMLDRRLTGGRAQGVIAAAAGGLLFAVHPIHVESVSWMAGRSDVICGLFFLPAAWLLLGYLQKGGLPRLAGALALGLGAFLCKETALGLLPFTLAAILLVRPRAGEAGEGASELSRAERRRRKRASKSQPARKAGEGGRRWFALLGVLVLTFVYLQIRASAIEAMRGTGFSRYVASTSSSFAEKLSHFFGALGFYGTKTLWPPPQNAFIAEIPGGVTVAVGVLLLAGFGAWIALTVFRRVAPGWQGELLAASLFFAALSPSLLIALFGISETPLAERYLYIPSAGACLLAGMLLVRATQRLPGTWQATLPLVMAGAIALPAAMVARERNGVWASDRSFWEDAVAKNPDQGLPHLHMGLVLAREGDRNGAIGFYKKATEVKYDREGRSKAYNNIASSYVAAGEYEIAISYCKKAIQEAGVPYPTPHYNWALASLNLATDSRDRSERLRLLTEAETRLREAVRINPRYTKAHYQLGRLLLRKNDADEAASHFEIAARYAPASFEGRKAREELEKLGR